MKHVLGSKLDQQQYNCEHHIQLGAVGFAWCAYKYGQTDRQRF